MSRLDEAALRRPEFVEGEPIVLADGQEWHFPRPILELYAVPTADGRMLRFDGIRRRQYGPDFDRKLEAFRAASTLADQMNALVNVAADLLSRNYDLQSADFGELLTWRSNDDANDATWQSIADVAGGYYAPKPEAVGSA